MEKVLKLYKYIDGSNDTPFPNVEYQAVVSDFRYDVKRMGGAPIITCTVMHTLCLDKLWSENVYAYFNGERFFIKQIPTSSYNNTDSRYKHELELVSERFVLDNVYFYDVVDSSENNDKPVSNSSKLSFFGDINEFASRLNQSLQYSNVDYSVVVDDGISSEAKMVSFQDQFFSGAIQEGYNTYNVPFYFEGKVIHFGYTNNAITRTFKYGDKESLLSIQKQNANYKVVNRVTGVGSEDNIPYYYPNDYESKEEVEANGGTWINPQTNLMPSIYRESLGKERFYEALNNAYQIPGSDEYYEFENPYIEGKPKEHIVNFDNVKPTIKGVENASGYRVDMFSNFAYDANDNDEVDKDGNYLHPYFFAKLRKFDGEHGFNLFDHAIDEQEMTIAMTSGSCGSCEFVIGVDESTQKNTVQVDSNGYLERDDEGNVKFGAPQDKQNDTINNEVWIALRKDVDTFGVIMPNTTNNYKPSVNDTFVILHIDLPKAYILDAEKRLEDSLIKYMAMNNDEKFNFSISFSRIYFAEHPEVLEQLNENARLQIEYDNERYELYVSSYSYAINSGSTLPEVKVELSDTLTINQNALQNAIDAVKQDILSSFGGGDFLKQGLKYFLRKDVNDRSRGFVASDKGFEVGKFTEGTLGSGASIYKDETNATHIEADYLKIRRKATFNTITVQELKHVGGEIVLSPAAMVCSKVEESDKGWKCYFNTENSEGRRIYQEFEVNDLAKCQTFNLSPKGVGDLVGNHYYWRKVVSIGDNYIELSKDDCDDLSDIPLEGDNISQLGNTTNTERQAAIILSAYGDDAPSYKQYNGIDGFSLEGKQVTKLSPYGNELTGVLNIEAGSKGWNNIEGLPDSIQNAVNLANKAQETIDGTTIGAVNLLQNSGFTGSYQSEDMVASDILSDSTELFSRKTDKWEGNITVYADSNAVSGYSAQLGNISQQVKELIAGEKYVVSFKARGSTVNLSCGNFKVEQKLTSVFTKYSFKFEFGGSRTFSMDGNARICDLQMERGTISTDWNPSPYDNDKSFAEFQSLKYLQDAIVNGNTSVLGGLILASMLNLGNYKDGKMQKVNAGVSGICNDENDVAFWAGGSFENAIKTIMKFKENPQYKPTESEWASLAKFAVSHGGDAVFRGTIFAENGIFRGRLEAEEGFLHGKFETSIEGNRIVIDPEDKSLKMYNGAGLEILTMTFVDGGENWTWGEVNLKRYNYDSETEQGVLAFESRMTASDVDLYNRIDNTWTRMTTQGYQVTASANERHYNIITSLKKRYLDNANFVYVSSIQSDCWSVDAANVGIGEVYAEPEYDDEGTLLSRVLKVKV